MVVPTNKIYKHHAAIKYLSHTFYRLEISKKRERTSSKYSYTLLKKKKTISVKTLLTIYHFAVKIFEVYSFSVKLVLRLQKDVEEFEEKRFKDVRELLHFDRLASDSTQAD